MPAVGGVLTSWEAVEPGARDRGRSRRGSTFRPLAGARSPAPLSSTPRVHEARASASRPSESESCSRYGLARSGASAELARVPSSCSQPISSTAERASGASARRRECRVVAADAVGVDARCSARSTVSRWNWTMSTTGCRVGTRVISAPIASQRRGGSAGPLGRRAPRPRVRTRARVVHGREMAVQELLRLVRLRRHACALAQLQHRLLGGRPVAARAGDEPAPVVGDRDRRRGERLLDRGRAATRCPRRSAPRSRRPRQCSSPCGTSSPRSPVYRRRPRRKPRRAGSRPCP